MSRCIANSSLLSVWKPQFDEFALLYQVVDFKLSTAPSLKTWRRSLALFLVNIYNIRLHSTVALNKSPVANMCTMSNRINIATDDYFRLTVNVEDGAKRCTDLYQFVSSILIFPDSTPSFNDDGVWYKFELH